MKREQVIASVLAMSLVTCACQAEDTTPELVSGGTQASAMEETEGTAEAGSFLVEYQGIAITPGDEAQEKIAALGDDYDYYEGASCAYVGMDKTYDYGYMTIYTYEADEGEFVSVIEVKDDTVNCNGFNVGCSVDDVTKDLGEPDSTYEGGVSYTRDGINLQFVTNADGIVTTIMYGEAE
ncbi:MAG: hypothetical protein K5745_04680 [Saccharofermentans sp.]|nr:hypothetical protein [Saccharofermentans sp.]